ncbi:hypothetical protein CHH28_04900 [Bacterioplanes sanyensis]|uniref:Uncharacterized protein n=1 Tax=Bacterioplanes sanyensis TaxID=1249553 RepID=A0A222FH29_9GAMM|nr:hypothetical protein [Bacterioplanes sanyensis]ASP38060.1 hypothetical protein CHH28_04900 [Bacterioplanes sanyensis]
MHIQTAPTARQQPKPADVQALPLLQSPRIIVQWQQQDNDGIALRSDLSRLPSFNDAWRGAMKSVGHQVSDISRYQYSSLLPTKQEQIEPTKWLLRTEQQALDIHLTLRSGRQVSLQWRQQSGVVEAEVNGQPQGMMVQRASLDSDISAPLSEAEQKQLSELMQRIDGLASELENGNFDLSALDLAQWSQLASLRIQFRNDSGQTLQLAFQQDDQQRQLKLDWNGHQLDLTVATAGWGSALNREQAANSLQQYLQLIESGLSDGKVNDAVRDMVAAALAMLQQPSAAANQDRSIVAMTGAAQTLMTGVADFSLHYQSPIERPNPDPSKRHEKVSTQLQLQQHTEVHSQGLNLQLRQTQLYQLDASYYLPVKGFDEPDFGSQSYRYVTLSQRSERIVEADYQQGQLQRLQRWDDYQWQQREQTYLADRLVADEQRGDHQARFYELTELVTRQYQPGSVLDGELVDELLGGLVVQQPKAAIARQNSSQ